MIEKTVSVRDAAFLRPSELSMGMGPGSPLVADATEGVLSCAPVAGTRTGEGSIAPCGAVL